MKTMKILVVLAAVACLILTPAFSMPAGNCDGDCGNCDGDCGNCDGDCENCINQDQCPQNCDGSGQCPTEASGAQSRNRNKTGDCDGTGPDRERLSYGSCEDAE